MIRKTLALALVAALLAVPVVAEVLVISISATDASATRVFPKPVNSVLICNWGANEVFFRLFTEVDTTAAATTSSIELVAGTATAPICISYDVTATQPGRFAAISTICNSGETATVTVQLN
jgi:hypothetical protein